MKIFIERLKGMTLDHIIIAIFLFGVVFTLAVMFFLSESKQPIPEVEPTFEESVFEAYLPKEASAQQK